MSQADIVLEMLRERGPRGVHTFEIYGVYIMNPSQRIAELEKRGHVITPVRERFKPDHAMGARYTLTCDTGVAGGDERGAPEHSGGPTDPAEPASTPQPSAGGHQLVRDVEASAHPACSTTLRADGPTDSPPPSVGGQLFDPADFAETDTPRPHYLEAAA